LIDLIDSIVNQSSIDIFQI